MAGQQGTPNVWDSPTSLGFLIFVTRGVDINNEKRVTYRLIVCLSLFLFVELLTCKQSHHQEVKTVIRLIFSPFLITYTPFFFSVCFVCVCVVFLFPLQL